jgi:beta-phosphoglucomutase-like phosphatase (HAD superfamily)
MNDQNDLNALIQKIEKKAHDKAEAKAREGKLSDDDKKHLEEIVSLFNDLERQGVLSYRAVASVEGKPRVLRFAIKGAQPVIITISSNKVSFEKLQPDGRRETLKGLNISNPSDLTRYNMIQLINNISEE